MPTSVIAGRTGIPEADAEVLRSLRGSEQVPTRHAGPVGVGLPVDDDRTRIITASDGDEEVRSVRAVVEAVQ